MTSPRIQSQSTVTIAHVLHRLYLAGAEVLAAGLARQLQGRRLNPNDPASPEMNFVFLCLDEVGPLGEELAGEGFAVESLDRQAGIDWGLGKRMRTVFDKHQVNLVHAHQYTPYFYSALGRGRPIQKRPILFTEHGRHYPDTRKLKHVIFNRLMLKKPDRVTAVGNFVRQALVNNEGIKAGRIEVIYNGVDGQAFMPGADVNRAHDYQLVRRELGIAADEMMVLQVARFHPVKDHETAVRAFAQVANKVQQVRLVLVGDGEQRSAMEKLTAELGIKEKVVFAGVRSDIPQLMAAADLFILSSLSEGVSVTILEAMASQLPVVATDVGGNAEIVSHGTTGLLSPRQQPGEMAANLVTLLEDGELRQKMGEAGRQTFVDRFTLEQMHRHYEQLYRDMIR